MQPTETDTRHLFSQFETAGEILGFVYRRIYRGWPAQLFTLDETKRFLASFWRMLRLNLLKQECSKPALS